MQSHGPGAGAGQAEATVLGGYHMYLGDQDFGGADKIAIENGLMGLGRYAEAADTLRRMGRFYEAWETPTELDLKRKKQLNMGKPPVYDRAALALTEEEKTRLRDERGAGVWRFKLDHDRIEWTDGILGDISIDAASVSDPVLIRQDGQVLYTLASVVDDVEMGAIRRGLVPDQMEVKWFVYFEKDRLYFHRSWTGTCIYVVQFHVDEHSYRMISAEVNRDPEQYSQKSDEFDARLIDYLIDVLLLRHEASYPAEDDFVPKDPLAMWSLVGRAAVGQHPDRRD